MNRLLQISILVFLSFLLVGAESCKGSKKKSKGKSSSKSSIQFSTARWSAVRGLAQEQNKPIFIDFYTDWCAPCKVMDRDIFRDPSVKRFMDANFINYKVNGEKGEGKLMVLNYGVDAYPFLAFVDPEGEAYITHRGSLGLSQFKRQAENALAVHKSRYPVSND